VSANGRQPNKQTRERRIIDRPRLIKLLDETEARVILLLAPAGYGKTTLARQWVKRLNGAIWVSCTPAHRDVVTFAEDVAKGIDALGGNSVKFLREYVSAQNNPQRVAHRIARALAEQCNATGVQWLIVDDYHELLESPEAEQLLEALQEAASMRLMVSSRIRPTWASSRRAIYGEVSELGREALTMNQQESHAILGNRAATAELARQADGWPAVLALAAAAGGVTPPVRALPAALHTYLAQELFERAESELQDHLVRLAVLPVITRESLRDYLGVEPLTMMDQARELGFFSEDDPPDLHPLLREFLLDKLSDRADASEQIRHAIEYCLDSESWAGALRLVTRFRCDDLIEPVLRRSFKPLVRSGRIETLSQFGATVRARPSFPPPSVDVVEAEAALRDGHIRLAGDLARRVQRSLGDDHPLRSRASAIAGHSSFQHAAFADAELAFSDARLTALDDRDETEAVYGLSMVRIFGEQTDPTQVVQELHASRYTSPARLVRAATVEIARRRFIGDLARPLPIDEAEHALPQVEDPRIRTAFIYQVAYTLGQQANYREANEWLLRLSPDVQEYDLEFVRQLTTWTTALVRLGLRRFGEAERLLQSLEDAIAEKDDVGNALNARILRARILLQTSRGEEAIRITSEPPSLECFPSWRAEYFGIHALALACSDADANAVSHAAQLSEETSRSVDVRMLAESARAVLSANHGDARSACALLRHATEVGALDPVVCALRSSAALADALAKQKGARKLLEDLYASSNDLGLARRAGFRTRAKRNPGELLSPREAEVLGLLAQGLRNRDIAQALYIAPSTTKVHVRHVLEKLGVRTRTEAAARFKAFESEI
jgi:LuxR family transcriptional regulator, maltose regulon positive regulatory protein